jgi:hypothetical protein
VAVRRGAGKLDPATFRLGDVYADPLGLLRSPDGGYPGG